MLGSRDNTRKKPKCLSGGGRPVNRGYTIALITSQGTQMRKAEATTKDTRMPEHIREQGVNIFPKHQCYLIGNLKYLKIKHGLKSRQNFSNKFLSFSPVDGSFSIFLIKIYREKFGDHGSRT